LRAATRAGAGKVLLGPWHRAIFSAALWDILRGACSGRIRAAGATREEAIAPMLSTDKSLALVKRAALASTALLFAAAPSAEAGCSVYEDRDFLGATLTIEDNQSLAHLGSLNDRISSIVISPGCLLIAYADPEFAGAVTTFSAGKHPTLPDGWDDQISSARCNCR
jgi:hypothetical protein